MLFFNRIIFFFCFFLLLFSCSKTKLELTKWGNWYRPVDNSVFTFNHGNNHDPIIFVDSNLEYPYHLLVSGWGCTSETNNFLIQVITGSLYLKIMKLVVTMNMMMV